MNLKQANILITGGSTGIGKAAAQTLIAAGANVAITGRNAEALQLAAKELGALPICADVSKEDDVKRSYAEFFNQFDKLDVLINNAGFGVFKHLVDQDRESFDAVFATNVTGSMLMAREAAIHFAKQHSGNIINIASTAGLRGGAYGTAYYASKFALRGMTECWRAELRKHNVRVMLINPSEVITQFAHNAGHDQNANDSKLQAEDIAHAIRSVLEMNDRGFSTEVTVFATNPKD